MDSNQTFWFCCEFQCDKDWEVGLKAVFENCQSCGDGFLLFSANPCLSGFLETKLTPLKSTYPELLLLEVGCLDTANSFYTNEDFLKKEALTLMGSNSFL